MYAAVESSSGNVPAFLLKLWALVEDPGTDHLIQWDSNGASFHVYDQQSFSREILPMYFKHNNIASFIRQLNMYGFRKVSHIDQGGLKIEKDDLQFQHQYFQKGEQDMLQFIKRKSVKPETVATTGKPDDYSRVLTDVNQVKVKQDSMDDNLEYIRRENKLLWREVAVLRSKHNKQQQIVNKLIQFLVSLVSSSRTGLTIPPIRRMPLAISDASQFVASPSPSGDMLSQPDTPSLKSSPSSTILQADPTGMTNSLTDADGNTYTIESPKSDNFLVATSPGIAGPVIHELTELPAPLPVSVSKKVTPSRIRTATVIPSKQIYQTPPTAPRMALVASPTPSQTTMGNFLMSPPIAPSLQDAFNFGLNVPTASNVAETSPSPQKRKRRSTKEDASPKKKLNPSVSTESLQTPEPGTPSTLEQLAWASQEDDSNTDVTGMTVASPGGGNHGAMEDFTLNNDQLDLLSSDLSGVKSILSEQYNLDPNFLMELFENSGTFNINMKEEETEDTNSQIGSYEDRASTSGSASGHELVEYSNPNLMARNELFPELMDGYNMADIDDID